MADLGTGSRKPRTSVFGRAITEPELRQVLHDDSQVGGEGVCAPDCAGEDERRASSADEHARCAVRCGDFSLGEVRGGRPVVGAPVPGESRVTHVEMVEYAARDDFEEDEPLAGAVLSMVLHDAEHADGAGVQQTLTKIASVVPCFHGGVLLSEEELPPYAWVSAARAGASSHDDEVPDRIPPGCMLAHLLRDAFFVSDELWDAARARAEADVVASPLQAAAPEHWSARALRVFRRRDEDDAAEDAAVAELAERAAQENVIEPADEHGGDAGGEGAEGDPEAGADVGLAHKHPAEVRVQVSMELEPRSGELKRVTVRAIEAIRVPQKSLSGCADCYVVAYLVNSFGARVDPRRARAGAAVDPRAARPTKNGAFRTATSPDTLTPFWNSAFAFEGGAGAGGAGAGGGTLNQAVLVIELWHENRVVADEPLGIARLGLAELHAFARRARSAGATQFADMWCPLSEHEEAVEESMKRGILGIPSRLQAAAKTWAQKRVVTGVENAVGGLKRNLVWKVSGDYFMPHAVRAVMRNIGTSMMDEIDNFLMDLVKGKMNVKAVARMQSPFHARHVGSVFSLGSCGYSLVAFWRYTLYPFDRTIWFQLRDPAFWLIVSLGFFSWSSVACFVFRFLIVDRNDDYMLFAYIEAFKGIQVFQGMYGVVYGVVEYVQCATLIEAGAASHCKASGPSVAAQDWVSIWEHIFLFAVEVLTVWAAIILMDYSYSAPHELFIDKRLVGAEIIYEYVSEGEHSYYYGDGYKRRERLHATITDYSEETGCHTLQFHDRAEPLTVVLGGEETRFKIVKLKGGHQQLTRWLLFWDMAVLFCCVAPVVVLRFTRNLKDWQVSQILYWVESIYKLLSLPFLVLKIPMVIQLFFHIAITGFDRNGKLTRKLPRRIPFHEFDADPDAKGFEGVCTSGRSLSELLAGSVGLLLVIGAIVAFFYILFYVALIVSGTTTRIL